MNIIESVIIGLIQGLTEFLPVSSSGHIVLMQKVFGIQEQQMFFGVMLHFATLVSVIIVLWPQIAAIIKNPFGKKTWMILIAIIPAGIAGIFLNDFFESLFGGAALGYMFLLTAAVLLLGEFLNKKMRKKFHKEVGLPDAVSMGLMQAVAIMPGLSRSGSTIAGGLFTGLERGEAARFSFLISIPVILGSFLLETYDVVKAGIGSIDWLPVLAGMIAAGVSGFFAVKFMLKIVEKKKLYGFAVYVAILGVFVLLDQTVFHFFF